MLSLFMVSMMVKKGGPAPLAPCRWRPPDPNPAKSRLRGDDEIAGSGRRRQNAMLDGMELDDEAVKAQQMLEQVTDGQRTPTPPPDHGQAVAEPEPNGFRA
jgi:hypothetical protein